MNIYKKTTQPKRNTHRNERKRDEWVPNKYTGAYSTAAWSLNITGNPTTTKNAHPTTIYTKYKKKYLKLYNPMPIQPKTEQHVSRLRTRSKQLHTQAWTLEQYNWKPMDSDDPFSICILRTLCNDGTWKASESDLITSPQLLLTHGLMLL